MFNTSLNNGGSEKVGTIKAFGGSVPPFGWLICDGSAISRTLYAALFDVIGENYGAGDGSTTFNIPDGKMPVGNSASVAVKGSGISLGMSDGSHLGGMYIQDVSGAKVLRPNIDSYGKSVGSNFTTPGDFTNGKIAGVTTDATKSGLIGVADLTSASAVSNAIIKY